MRKRYHRLKSGLDNENYLHRENAENSKSRLISLYRDLEVGNYIYVRSHKKRAQVGYNGSQVKHMVTVDTSTRPLWKKVASQRYLCRESRPLCDFRDKNNSGIFQEQAVTNLPCTAKSYALERYTCYKRISFPACGNVESKSGSPLASTAQLQRLTGLHSLDTSRERARKGRVSLLKMCKNEMHRFHEVQEQLVQKKWKGRIQYEEQGMYFAPQKEVIIKGKSVWKSFNSAFMRHGSKLRYQTVLRKALPTL